MRSKIFSLILAPALLAAVALTAHPAQAEANVKVPFSFTVAGQTCPAGLYIVHQQQYGDFVVLTSTKTLRSYTWTLGPGNPAPTDTRVILKFDESGNGYILRSIQYGSMVTSRLDGKSARSERISTVSELGQ